MRLTLPCGNSHDVSFLDLSDPSGALSLPDYVAVEVELESVSGRANLATRSVREMIGGAITNGSKYCCR